ncbi:MAG: 2-oxoacid:ferredoxin oxidoreductase subunit beta [Bacillota bacterium]|nr:2-oxoacid:ferredoxin oxidoreductase subunit beta [Bacillota bacterium]
MAITVTMADYRTAEKSWWCPGCGDFGVLSALQKTLVDLQRLPHEVAIIAGIGCSGKIGNYINCYNIHTTHGRTLPVATGIKLANRDLTVIAAGGDGDGYAIGMGHFMHALRRNVDMTYLVMDNHVYGLTKGQVSPTSDAGFITSSTPQGNLEKPVRPLELALASGVGFVAQGFSGWVPQLIEILKAAIEYRGFALVNVISPCVTYNKVNTYDYYREALTKVEDIPGYDEKDRLGALKTVMEREGLVTGILYREEGPALEDLLPGFREEPIVSQDLRFRQEDLKALLEEHR